MTLHIKNTEIVRTYKLHFEKPVFATDPRDPRSEIAFTDATVTLAAVWDGRSRTWKAKKANDGRPPTLELFAPQAKKLDGYGTPTGQDAFFSKGKLNVVPIPLSSITKERWNDETAELIRIQVTSAFWNELLIR